jgi:hypothetical protein
MFLVRVSNRWGLEGWNSYTNAYNRQLSIAAELRSRLYIRDVGTNNGQIIYTRETFARRLPFQTNNWAGGSMAVLIDNPANILNDVAYTAGTGFTATNFVRFYNLEPSPRFHIVTTNDLRFWVYDTAANRIVDFVSFNDLPTLTDLATNLYAKPSAANQQIGGTNFNDDMFWDPTPVTPGSMVTVGITNQLGVSAGDIVVDDDTWKAYRFNSPEKEGSIAKYRRFMGVGPRAGDPPFGNTPSPDPSMQAPFVPTRRMHQIITWQVNDPLVHYLPGDLPGPLKNGEIKEPRVRDSLDSWNIGRLNEVYHPWGGVSGQASQGDPYAFNVAIQDPGVRRSDDWEFPILDVDPRNAPQGYYYTYPNIGALGRVHRGTPWQTVYLKSMIQFGPNNEVVTNLHPSVWRNWAGSAGTFPMNDWRLLDVFTTAPNEYAARGLLSVNQEGRAAWSAVLSGVAVATNRVKVEDAGLDPMSPTNAFVTEIIQPGSPQIERIVRDINLARQLQFEVAPNPYPASNPRAPWLFQRKTNFNTLQPLAVFQSVGDVLSAPALTIQSPFLNGHQNHVQNVWSDRAVEQIPQQIMSLLQRDEPRFVVYAFGQSLKPAPQSLTTSADFYNLCTNYQVTGEVITKTTFRVEGELRNQANPLRAVVESFNILPPPE